MPLIGLEVSGVRLVISFEVLAVDLTSGEAPTPVELVVLLGSPVLREAVTGAAAVLTNPVAVCLRVLS